MKRQIAFLAALTAAFYSQARADVPAASAAAPVSVVFVSPENFTDLRSQSFASDRDRDYLVDEIKQYVVSETRNRVTSGQVLTVTFKDIDMAGDYEPWRIETRDVRIVKDIYPPRVKVSFKLVDAAGAVLKEGDRSLVDLNFMSSSTRIGASDPLFYEKQLISDWIQSEFPKAKKT